MTHSVPGSNGKAKYRLPPSLGGGEFVGEFGGYELGQYRYVGHIEGVGGTLLGLPRPLEEIKPPSIDDPAPWPLEIVNDKYWTVRLRDSAIVHGSVALEMYTPEGDPATGVVLTPDELRQFARAAWQRANAIEGGAA